MASYIPKLIFWETTQQCNLSCSHCRMEEDRKTDDLTTEMARYLIDAINVYNRVVLVFSGGEPLLREDIFDLINYAKEKGFITALATNGTLIDNSVINKILQTRTNKVSVSLDGHNEDIYSQFRNDKKAFHKALCGINKLVEAKINTQINTVVSKHNYNRLEEMINLVISLNIRSLHLFFVIQTGCGKNINKDLLLNSSEYDQTLRQIYDYSNKYKNELFIKVTCAPQYYGMFKKGTVDNQTNKRNSCNNLSNVTKGCLAGTGISFISSIGEVFPCGYLPVSAGNIFTNDFKNIWENSSTFNKLRSVQLLNKKCKTCNHVNSCGGCRARAYSSFNSDFMACDPLCTVFTN